jgi:hypothetical protein
VFESANNGKDRWSLPKASVCLTGASGWRGRPSQEFAFDRPVAHSGVPGFAYMADDREALPQLETGATMVPF